MWLYRRRLEIGAVVFWAVLVALSLAHNLGLLDQQAREGALARARMLFSVIETTRLWNANHGGLYALVTPDSPANPYLDLPNRDVVINGAPYTLINPAYMTRQISELVERQNGASFRITSLAPLRPDNALDPWERLALQRFAEGEAEFVERTEYKSQPVYRYMARLQVKQPCLECHAKQGYQVGDSRGGISVTIPATVVAGELAPQRTQAISLHLAGFVLLAGASVVFLGRLRSSWAALGEAKAAEERNVATRTAELSAAIDELARSNSELESFAYVASHDLQEPLRMISLYAQLIDRRYGERLDDEGREFLGYMSDGAGRMKGMIDDLLAYSRVGRGVHNFAATDTRVALDVALANLAGAIAEAGATVNVADSMPVVSGEMPLLARLFQNLVGNAIKYRRPEMAPVVTISVGKSGDYWRFAVADNGIGIPSESRDRIFQIFQRLHTRGSYPGTGIGLAIAKKIVERHGGTIGVAAAEGGGAEFFFTLPADVAPAEQDAKLQLDSQLNGRTA